MSVLFGRILARNEGGASYQLLPHGAEHPYGAVPGLVGHHLEEGDEVPFVLLNDDVQSAQIVKRSSRTWHMGPLPVADAWPTYCHDGGCSSNNAAAAAAWALALDSTWTAVPYLATGPVATSNALLFQTSSSDPSGVRLVLRDIATQANRWALPWSGSFNHPTVRGDAVYCFDGSSLFKLSLADGAVVWTATSARYMGLLLFDDSRGSVYVVNTIGPTCYVTALAQSDGTVLWTRTLPEGTYSTQWIVFASDLIQVGYRTGSGYDENIQIRLLALAPANGTTSWDTRIDILPFPDATGVWSYSKDISSQVISVAGVTFVCWVHQSRWIEPSPGTDHWDASAEIVGVSSSGTVLFRLPYTSDVDPQWLYTNLAAAGSDWVLVVNGGSDTLRAVSTSGSTLWTIASAGLAEGLSVIPAVVVALAGDTAIVVSSYYTSSGQRVRARTVTRSGSSSSWSTLLTEASTGDGPSSDGRNQERLILVGSSAFYWSPTRSLVRIV